MADEEGGDKVGGQKSKTSWDVKMKAEMKARIEKRKRRHSCGEVVAGAHGDSLGLAGEPPFSPLLGDVGQEKRKRRNSSGEEFAEVHSGGDALGAELPQLPLQDLQHLSQELDMEPPSDKNPEDKQIDEIARLVR